jgi:hypothetical protein
VTPHQHLEETDFKVRCLCRKYVGYNLKDETQEFLTCAPCGCYYVRYIDALR